MYDELTEVDFLKMIDEIAYRARALRQRWQMREAPPLPYR